MDENLATGIKVDDLTVTRAGKGSISLVQKSDTGCNNRCRTGLVCSDQRIMDFVAFYFCVCTFICLQFHDIFFHLECNFILFSWFPQGILSMYWVFVYFLRKNLKLGEWIGKGRGYGRN